MDLPRPRILRARTRAGVRRELADRLSRQRCPGRGRLAHAGYPGRERDRGARQRRRVARVRQRLPPPRFAPRRWQRRVRAQTRLPLSRVDLRSRRHAHRGARQRELSGPRQGAPRSCGGRAGDLARVRVRPGRGRWSVGRGNDVTLRDAGRTLPVRGLARVRAGDAASARGQLEVHRRQLFRRAPHSGRPPRPHPVVRQKLWRRGSRTRRSDVGRVAGPALGQLVRTRLSAAAAECPAPPGRTPAQLAVPQAVAQHRLRHLPRSGRFHAVAAGLADRKPDP